MKKIILFIVLFLSFTMTVNASEWQELKENISTEGIELEFRYRFYKEEISGDYFRVDVDSSHLYQYEDPEIKYGSFNNWQNTCDVDPNIFDIEVSDVVLYQEIVPTRYIKFKANNDITFLGIKVIYEDSELDYKIKPCSGDNCVAEIGTLKENDILTLYLNKEYNPKDLKILVDALGEDTASYELVTTPSSNSNNISLYKIINIYEKELIFDESYLSKSSWSKTNYTNEEIEEDAFTKILGINTMCRWRDIMTYRYNVIRNYYDDNYYTNIDGYIKDLEDYKIFYKLLPLAEDSIKETNEISNSLIPAVKVDDVETTITEELDTNDNVGVEDSILVENQELEPLSKVKNGNLLNTLKVSNDKSFIKYIIIVVIILTLVFIYFYNKNTNNVD